MQITEKDWEEVDKIGIERDFLSEQACGIWFKNFGSSFAIGREKQFKLLMLNIEIRNRKDKR